MKLMRSLILLGLGLAAFAASFVAIDRLGPNERLLLNPDHPAVKWDKYVRSKKNEGLKVTGPFVFITDNLQDLVAFEEAAKKRWPGRILGLTTIPTSETLGTDEQGYAIENRRTCLPATLADGRAQDLWEVKVRGDPVCNPYFVKGMGFLTFYFPPYGKANMEVGQDVQDFIQKEQASLLENIWNRDIKSKWPHTKAVGWSWSNYVLDFLLRVFYAVLGTFGTVFLFAIFYLNFRSARLALIGIFLGWVSLFLQRGTMGLAGLHETVLTPLASSIILVVGPSALFRIYEKRKWWGLVAFSSLVGVGGFITLLPIPGGFYILHIKEMALSACAGILYITALAIWVFPLFIDQREKQRKPSWLIGQYEYRIVRVAYRSWVWAQWFGKQPLLTVSGILALVAGSAILLMTGISTKTDVRAYIAGTESASYLQESNQNPDGTGQMYITTLFQMESEGNEGNLLPVEDPRFIKAGLQWIEAVKKLPKIRRVYNPLEGVKKASSIIWGGSAESERLPETIIEASQAWGYVTTPLASLWECFGYSYGVVIGISFAGNDDREMWSIVEQIRSVPTQKGVRITPFGDNVGYAATGEEITDGKIRNIFSSSLYVIATMVVMLVWMKRKYGASLNPWLGGPIASIPYPFALAMFLVLTCITRHPMDLATALITAFAIGASADFSPYFLDALAEQLTRLAPKEALEEIAVEQIGGVLKDAIQNGAAFAGFLLAPFGPVRELGVAMITIMALSYIGTAIPMVASIMLAVPGKSGLRKIPKVAPLPSPLEASER